MFACTDVIELDVDQVPDDRTVIQAMVTDSLMNHVVIISRSLGLYDTPEFRGITGATVYIEEWDSAGESMIRSFDYVELTNGDEGGLYISTNPFAGVHGRLYKLFINAEGKDYLAEDQLRPVAPMDSLVIRIDQERKEDLEKQNLDSTDEDFERWYELLLYATEPPNTIDYYKWNFYRNDTLENNEGRSLYYSDDKLIQENIDGFPAPLYYSKGDTFYVEQMSLTRAGYIFTADLDGAMNNDGGMFSPPPANPRTNISNGAFGFFQVSSVDTKWGIILDP